MTAALKFRRVARQVALSMRREHTAVHELRAHHDIIATSRHIQSLEGPPLPSRALKPGQHDVFLSYAAPDREAAQTIFFGLVSYGFSVWLDELENERGLEENVATGIHSSRLMVVLCTNAYFSPRARGTQSELLTMPKKTWNGDFPANFSSFILPVQRVDCNLERVGDKVHIHNPFPAERDIKARSGSLIATACLEGCSYSEKRCLSVETISAIARAVQTKLGRPFTKLPVLDPLVLEKDILGAVASLQRIEAPADRRAVTLRLLQLLRSARGTSRGNRGLNDVGSEVHRELMPVSAAGLDDTEEAAGANGTIRVDPAGDDSVAGALTAGIDMGHPTLSQDNCCVPEREMSHWASSSDVGELKSFIIGQTARHDYKGAAIAMERLVQVYKETGDAGDPSLAADLFRLGTFHHRAGNLHAALASFQEALRIDLETHAGAGGLHEDVAAARYQIARVYQDARRIADSVASCILSVRDFSQLPRCPATDTDLSRARRLLAQLQNSPDIQAPPGIHRPRAPTPPSTPVPEETAEAVNATSAALPVALATLPVATRSPD